MRLHFFLPLILITQIGGAKEIALTFDDAPFHSTAHFESSKRTDELIKKLKSLKVQGAMIFANPCKDLNGSVRQLKKYVDAGHSIANHTCTHPRLDEVGFATFSQDAKRADELLEPLFVGQKFFRYPFLNEGADTKVRDQMRSWLRQNRYRNGMVSVDNDDYLVSWAINQAKEKGKPIDYAKIEKIFLQHLLAAINYHDNLALQHLGRSPKHVILLHEMDATVMFIEPLIKTLRQRGWTIISAQEAYEDKIYFEQPQNSLANNGILAQLVTEKTGQKVTNNQSEQLKAELINALDL